MLEEEFATLGDLIIQQPLKDETGQEIAVVGIARPTAYQDVSGYFCCYEIAYASGTVRMLEQADSAPRVLRAALDNSAARVYDATDRSAPFDRWQGFPQVDDVPEASDRLTAEDWVGATPFLLRLAERGIAWARSMLGVAFLGVQGVEANREQAIHWVTLAARQGDPGSSDMLASLYGIRESEYYDEVKSKYYAERAALCGIGIFAGPVEKSNGDREH